MQRHLHFVVHAYELKILSFVLMSNHFHMLLMAPKQNLSEAMAFFLRETSREIVNSSSRINQTYGGRFFRSNIRSEHHFLNCYKYVYRNPVHAKLVARTEEYRWSTLHGLLGADHLQIPVHEDTTLFSDVEGTLKWLNTEPKEDHWEAIQKGLRRKIFKLAKDSDTKGPHDLEILRL